MRGTAILESRPPAILRSFLSLFISKPSPDLQEELYFSASIHAHRFHNSSTTKGNKTKTDYWALVIAQSLTEPTMTFRTTSYFFIWPYGPARSSLTNTLWKLDDTFATNFLVSRAFVHTVSYSWKIPVVILTCQKLIRRNSLEQLSLWNLASLFMSQNLGFMSPVSIPLANVLLALKYILNSQVSIAGRNESNGFHWETGRHLSKIMDSILSSPAKRSQERLCWGQIWTVYLKGRQ